MRELQQTRRGSLNLLLACGIAALLAQPAQAAEDLLTRLKAAGFKTTPDQTYVWTNAPVMLHLVPGLPLRRPACLEVQVGTRRESTSESLNLNTPEMVKLAVETLRGPEAALAFEYVVQGSPAKPLALRDAMIRWAEAANWLAIDENSKPVALDSFQGWLILGLRRFKPHTTLVVSVARPL